MQLGGFAASCSQSDCHGNDPRGDKNRILAGAQVVNIENALQSVNEMQGLDTALGLTPTDLEDIAFYIWHREGNQQCPTAAPSVSASPNPAAFGNQNVGTTSAGITVTVTNSGGANATGMSYGAPSAPFARTANTCTATLAAGANCTMTFTFSPTAGGSFNQIVAITGSGGTNVSLSLTGTGVSATPNLQATPSSAAFGSVQVGQTSVAQQFSLSNTGGAQATGISFANPNSAEFLLSGSTCGATLNAGASCTFNVAYKPAATGADNATLLITSNAPTVNITMTGAGTAPAAAALSATPSSLAFGSVTVGATSATKSVTVTNTGGAGASSVAVGNGNANEFIVSGNTCGATLAAGASCSFNVAYAPSAAGADNASISISYTGGLPATVAMTGTGTAPAAPNVQAAPGSLAFGSVSVGTTAAAKTVTVSNSGGASATGLAVASSDAAEFPLSGNTCGATLAAGASCTVNVAYAPTAAAADNGTLTISFSGGSPVAVTLSGTGTAAPAANLSAAPAPIAFGNVTVGQISAGTTVTVANGGTAAATNVAFANSNAAEFAVSGNTCGATLAAGASCTFAVAYSPAAAGADSATITITYAGGGAVSIALSGTGVAGTPPPGTGALSLPAAAPFGSQTVGTASAAQTITLSNTGGAAVTVSAITSSNAGEFAVSASNCGVVNAGASCSFALTFTPAAAGSRSATVTVASNGAGSPQAIAASGTGVAGGTPPPTGGVVTAIEYYHADFDHYFMTHIADEITKLDDGTFKGWTRTGKSFKVHADAAAGLNAVCRFFSTAFGAKSSHFYTPNAPECDVVKASPSWTFEAEVFHVVYPAFDGSCPAGTIPVFRMYNDGQGGAPNHRYTTEMAVRNAMLALGWIAEGAGTIGVIMCAPQ
ncbi:MAG: choice-of-anchor D domain-containing protein [Burkholderiales bacterium]|nr:choice-of-anchor D domain-containing protein [Burkholderiales bacterium]